MVGDLRVYIFKGDLDLLAQRPYLGSCGWRLRLDSLLSKFLDCMISLHGNKA
jgi:hypothetical protein